MPSIEGSSQSELFQNLSFRSGATESDQGSAVVQTRKKLMGTVEKVALGLRPRGVEMGGDTELCRALAADAQERFSEEVGKLITGRWRAVAQELSRELAAIASKPGNVSSEAIARLEIYNEISAYVAIAEVLVGDESDHVEQVVTSYKDVADALGRLGFTAVETAMHSDIRDSLVKQIRVVRKHVAQGLAQLLDKSPEEHDDIQAALKYSLHLSKQLAELQRSVDI